MYVSILREKHLGRKMILIVCMIIENGLFFDSTFSITFQTLTTCLAFSRARPWTLSEAFSERVDERMLMKQHWLSEKLSFSNQGVLPGGHACSSEV